MTASQASFPATYRSFHYNKAVCSSQWANPQEAWLYDNVKNATNRQGLETSGSQPVYIW